EPDKLRIEDLGVALLGLRQRGAQCIREGSREIRYGVRRVQQAAVGSDRVNLWLDVLGDVQTLSVACQKSHPLIGWQTLLGQIARPGPIFDVLQELIMPIQNA